MRLEARKHTITQEELIAVKGIGVQVFGLDDSSYVFLNHSFANFEPLTFFSELFAIFSPLSVDPIILELRFDNTQSTLKVVIGSNNYDDERNGLFFFRTFFRDEGELIVSHDFFRLPAAHCGFGIAKQALLICLQQYLNMGVQKIKVHAALDGGGYAWARYGFTIADKNEVDTILSRAEAMLDPNKYRLVLLIYNDSYSKFPNGEAFPIIDWADMPFMPDVLRGSDWNGIIDLNNQEQFHKFIYYATGQ